MSNYTPDISPTTSSTLLDYALATLPDPIQASPVDGNTVYASLTFLISNGSNKAVSLSQVQFELPVGKIAQKLTNDPGAVLYGSSPTGQWDIKMTSSGVFTALPSSGEPVSVTTSGIVIQLFNIPVNQEPGTFELVVKETASSSSEPSQVRKATFTVAKFPYGFFFSNFTSQVPLVEVDHPVTLTWDGSDQATYMMYWGDAQPQDVTAVRAWTSPNLTMDTTFLLRAKVVYDKETVIRDLTTTVIVADPELQASTLKVTGVASLEGNTTIGAAESNLPLTINAPLTSNGSVQLNNGLTADKLSTMANLTVNQQFTASDQAKLGSTTTQDLTVQGTLTTPGVVSIIQTAVALNAPATYETHTDGLIIGTISSPSEAFNTFGTVQATYNTGNQPVIASATASYLETVNLGSSSYSASFVLPVPSGTAFVTSMPQLSDPPPVVQIWFIPLGKANNNPVTRISSVAEAEPGPETAARAAPENTAMELLKSMADILTDGPSDEKKERLQGLAAKLFKK